MAPGQEMLRRRTSSDFKELQQIPPKLGDYVSWAIEGRIRRGRFQVVYLIALCSVYGLTTMQTFSNMFASSRVTTWHLACGDGACPPLEESSNCSVPLSEWRADSPGTSTISEFKLLCENHEEAPAMDSMFFVGWAFGIVLVGTVSDSYGRRSAYLLAYSILGAGGLLGPLAHDVSVYAAARLLLGAGVAGTCIVAYVWATEFLDASSRNVMAWLPNVLFSAGQILDSPLAYYIPQWRTFLWAVQGVVLVGVLNLFFLRESPQWLAANGYSDEVHVVLSAMATTNGCKPPPPPLKQGVAQVEGEEPVPVANAAQVGFFRQICDRRLRFRIGVMCINWFAISSAFYGLSMRSQALPLSIYWANVVTALVAVPFYMVSAPLIGMTWCGRRGAVSGSFFVGGLCLILSTFVEEATLALLVYYLGFGALSLGFGVLYVWAAELFPTTIRVRCMSVQSLAARFGAIASPFINDLGTTHPALSLMIFAAPCVIAGVLDLWLPETRDVVLPNTLDDIADDATPNGRGKNGATLTEPLVGKLEGA